MSNKTSIFLRGTIRNEVPEGKRIGEGKSKKAGFFLVRFLACRGVLVSLNQGVVIRSMSSGCQWVNLGGHQGAISCGVSTKGGEGGGEKEALDLGWKVLSEKKVGGM